VPRVELSSNRISSAIFICPSFFEDEKIPYKNIQSHVNGRAIALIYEMTRVQSIAGTINLSEPGQIQSLKTLKTPRDRLRNADSYALFALCRYYQHYFVKYLDTLHLLIIAQLVRREEVEAKLLPKAIGIWLESIMSVRVNTRLDLIELRTDIDIERLYTYNTENQSI